MLPGASQASHVCLYIPVITEVEMEVLNNF